MKSQRWYIFFRGDAYAMGPIDLGFVGAEADARQWARDWSKVNRLPNGFQCWPAS